MSLLLRVFLCNCPLRKLLALILALPLPRDPNSRADCNADGNPNGDIVHGGSNGYPECYADTYAEAETTDLLALRRLVILVGHVCILLLKTLQIRDLLAAA